METLRACKAALFESYLERRVKKGRIKKESTIKIYWRWLLCKYIDVAGHSMDNGTEYSTAFESVTHDPCDRGV